MDMHWVADGLGAEVEGAADVAVDYAGDEGEGVAVW